VSLRTVRVVAAVTPARDRDEPAPAALDDHRPADELEKATPPPGRRDPGPDGCGLCFERPGGPLVVVCGLHGGAGTSTLACALAVQAARESPGGRVLLCESAAAAGDVASLTAATSPYSLSELAAEYQARRRPSGFLARCGELGVIAGAMAPAPSVADGAIAGVLCAARRRHALTVVDAGTVRTAGTRELLQAATHVLWIAVERPGGVERAQCLLASSLVPALAARRLLAVRAPRRRHQAGGRWRDLAEQHCERLVLVPHSAGVNGQHVELHERGVRGTLTAVAGFLTMRDQKR
jgi:hypothetical protein